MQYSIYSEEFRSKNDDNKDHYIVLKKYESVNKAEGNLLNYEGVLYNEIYINKEGNVVEESVTKKLDSEGFHQHSLLCDLKKKKLIKEMI